MLCCYVEISTYSVHMSVSFTDLNNEVVRISWKQSIFIWNEVTNFLFNYIFLMKITYSQIYILAEFLFGLRVWMKRETKKADGLHLFLFVVEETEKQKPWYKFFLIYKCNGENWENNLSTSIWNKYETYQKFFEACW